MTDPYVFDWYDLPPREHRPFAAAVVRALLWLAVLALLLGPWLAGSAHGEGGDVERWRPLVSQYEWDADTALAIIRCESGGDPTVPNRQGSGALGLFQVMPRWRYLARIVAGSDNLADPRVNAATAYALYGDFGWSPWDSSARCWR